LAAKAAGNDWVNGRMTAGNDKRKRRITTQQPTNEGISKSGRWWAATTATLQLNGNATATMMGGDGRCDGNATATTAIERTGNDGSAPTSGGRQQRQSYGMSAMQGRL
jgi:hypothetical protein